MNDLLNKELEKICKKNKLVGANVALFDSEQIVYSYNYGYANKEQQIKSTNDVLQKIMRGLKFSFQSFHASYDVQHSCFLL